MDASHESQSQPGPGQMASPFSATNLPGPPLHLVGASPSVKSHKYTTTPMPCHGVAECAAAASCLILLEGRASLVQVQPVPIQCPASRAMEWQIVPSLSMSNASCVLHVTLHSLAIYSSTRFCLYCCMTRVRGVVVDAADSPVALEDRPRQPASHCSLSSFSAPIHRILFHFEPCFPASSPQSCVTETMPPACRYPYNLIVFGVHWSRLVPCKMQVTVPSHN